jgi:hypothetical protein
LHPDSENKILAIAISERGGFAGLGGWLNEFEK